jgi:hypothetical protein
VGGQIIEDDTDTLGLGEVNVSEFAHAAGEVDCGPALGDFDLTPGPMDVEEDEQVGGSVAVILAIIALELARPGRDRLADLANQLNRALVEADHWTLRIGPLCVEIEHVLHPGDVFSIDLRSRHSALFSRQSAFGSPDGAHARTGGLHQEAAEGCSQHRIAR